MSLNRERISQRFGSAVEHYDQAAKPQRAIAEELATMLKDALNYHPRKVLELGCGTGLLSQNLTELVGWEGVSYTFNDLIAEVEPLLRAKLGDHSYRFIIGDAESTTWGRGYDLIASSSCVQWWLNPLSFVEKASESLQAGSLLAFSTFLPGNLGEIDSLVKRSLNYPKQADWERELSQNGFEVIESKTTDHTLRFATLFHLLKHLKETGTNALDPQSEGLWTPVRVRSLDKALREELQLGTDEPLILTYKALLITARKKPPKA